MNEQQQCCKRQMVNTATVSFTQTGPVRRERNCNGFTAINYGDTPVIVNGITLFPSATPATVVGDIVSFGFNDSQIYVGQIKFNFIQPVGVAPLLTIIQTFFVKDEGQ